MPSDRSRSSNDRRYQYKGVVSQQGRVILDRDFNALQDITDGRIEADALDMIGPCGTPDDGFAISIPDTSPPSPPLWSPPAPLPAPFLHPFDFLIAPGTMYVGGQRAVFPERQAGQAVTYSYFDQPDFIRPNDPLPFDNSPPGQSGIELVYLHVFEQEVSAVEDSDLLDVALGGVDTTQRLRLMRRVRRLPVQTADCASAWADATALWLAQNGLYLDPETLRLIPQVKLRVGFTQVQALTDPCDPVAKGGYLGADNQLIRVQISDAGVRGDATQPAKLLWGYDNASFLYRVAAVVANGSMLRLTQDPPDQFHIPQTGQVVEILKSAAILESEPDETDPTGQRTIVRCVAEATGVVRKLTQRYGPASSSDTTKYIVLDQPLPLEYANDTNPLFLRVWQTELSFNAAGGTVELSDPATQATTGITVTLSVPQGEALTKGAFWLIAVRPSTPQAVYPEQLLVTPQPPDGPREWACPLAVIDWIGRYAPVVHDCRCVFDNLVTLTKRKLGGCCTVSVSPDDLTATNTLQSIVDHAAGRAAAVTVCLAPGIYRLSQTLRLTEKHSDMVIEACPGGVTIEAVPNPAPGAFVDGLVALTGANRVTLRGIAFVPGAEPVAPVLSSQTSLDLVGEWSSSMGRSLAGAVLSDIVGVIGLHVVNSSDFTVERCSFRFSQLPPPSPDIFGAGILLHGACSGLTIRGCSFDSDLPPTFTQPQFTIFAPAGTAAPAATAREPATAGSGVTAAADRLPVPVGRPPIALPRGFAVFRQPLVATVGCLANFSTTVFGGFAISRSPCLLGDVCLRDNSFNNLTWAVYSAADARTARLEGNSVTQCGGGFWIELNDFHPPSDQKTLGPLFTSDQTAASSFQEWAIFVYLSQYYPPTLPGTVPTSAAFSLFLTNNQIEAMLPTLTSPPSMLGSSSLVILANQPVVQNVDTTTSLLISDNRLRGANPYAPTALIVVPGYPQSAVTGNLIFNTHSSTNGPPPSLHIIPDSFTPKNSTNVVPQLAVVGNVCFGPTNLSSLTRPEGFTSPFDTWIPFNTILYR